MFHTFTPGPIAAKSAGALRSSLIAPAAAIVAVLLSCNVVDAQVSAVATPTPSIGATSPLGMVPGTAPDSTVGSAGIPLGSTEINSAGLSPAPAAAALL